ncbi:SphA family protein [Leptospira interrogans]
MTIASWNICRATFIVAATLALQSQTSQADENGVSLWLPGQFGSLAAVPVAPGWSLGMVGYHTSVGASGNVAAARQIQIGQIPATANVNLNANLSARGDLLFISPTYTFATSVLGGQLAIGVIGVVGHLDTSIAGTLTSQVGPIVATRNGVLSDSLTGVGDLYPLVTMKWNQGVHNYMVYGYGDIPVGAYESTRLSNIGIGHGGIDFGAGYTYLNPASGVEFSGVGGFTYNFKNPTTQYQNGIDFHFDWGASHFLSKQLFVGAVGYAYQQITDDFGAAAFLGGFKSRVFGLGPQLGYLFPVGDKQGYLNLKGYREFAADNRPEGWNVWLTFAISNAAPTSTVSPTRHSISK